MGILISGTTNDIQINGSSVATDAEVSSAVAPLATTAYVDGKMVLMTAQNSTSGTSIDFTGIPNWAKKITVMFNGVSTSGTSIIQLQIGSGAIDTTGYTSQAWYASASSGIASTGFYTTSTGIGAIYTNTGIFNIFSLGSNNWIESGIVNVDNASNVGFQSIGRKTLSGTLDRIRITTVNGTDTFDAGSINIMYEG